MPYSCHVPKVDGRNRTVCPNQDDGLPYAVDLKTWKPRPTRRLQAKHVKRIRRLATAVPEQWPGDRVPQKFDRMLAHRDRRIDDLARRLEVLLWIASAAVEEVLPAGIVNVAIRDPVENWIVPSPPPASGVKVRLNCPEMVAGGHLRAPVFGTRDFMLMRCAMRAFRETDGELYIYPYLRDGTMGAMKTTVEIADSLFAEAKSLAEAAGVSLRQLIGGAAECRRGPADEEAVHASGWLLSRQRPAHGSVLA